MLSVEPGYVCVLFPQMMFAGEAVGASFWGIIADKYGRKTVRIPWIKKKNINQMALGTATFA